MKQDSYRGMEGSWKLEMKNNYFENEGVCVGELIKVYLNEHHVSKK